MAPTLSDAAEEAFAVWVTMGGWFPERLPVVLALVGAIHVDGLHERLLAIRSAIGEQERAARND